MAASLVLTGRAGSFAWRIRESLIYSLLSIFARAKICNLNGTASIRVISPLKSIFENHEMESLSILLRTAPKIRPRDLNAMYDNTVSLDNYWLDPSWSAYVFPSRLLLGRKCHRRQFPYSIQCKPSTISIEESLGPLNDSLVVLEIETITIA